jgi:polyphosphate kinase 2 (PPK2 family)
VKPGAWENWGLYDRFIEASETIVKHSEKAGAPWHLIDGSQEYTRTVEVSNILLKSIRQRLNDGPPKAKAKSGKDWHAAMKKTRGTLDEMDLTPTLKRAVYNDEMKRLRRKLVQLQHRAQVADLATVLVFEGQDAAGKGGAIRRLVKGLAAQQYQVIPIAAPTDEELAHHYLWRFWRHLPRRGRVTIFDRSWYGRVLVERIEGFAKAAEWQRAYQEINEFESQLTDHGMVICKFWIQIDKKEQLRRFDERTNTPYKQWKITEEDWRNRKQWDAYTESVDDMVALTHKPNAPWTLVSGNNKLHARVTVLRTVCEQLEKALAGTG